MRVAQALRNAFLKVKRTLIFYPVTSGTSLTAANVKSVLGLKPCVAMPREVVGTYTLREQGEAYASDFGSKNDALTPDNTISWQKHAETTRT